MSVTQLAPEEIEEKGPELAELLIDVVDGGAAVSFIAPMMQEAADVFWQGVAADVARGTRLVFVAQVDGRVVGCVHLAVATQPNGTHRAEIQKLLIHSAYRRQGLATALMAAAEAEAQRIGRTLIVLDTEQGSVGEHLYERLGYQKAGVIPGFARSSYTGTLHGTVLFYKHLNRG
jgi:ribosomal protein S18 acetylase RimI-like enzyme